MRIAGLLVLAAIGAAGCTKGIGLVSAPTGGTYALVRVGDRPLPAAVPTSSGADARVAAGRLVLDGQEGFTLELGDGYKTTSYGGYGYAGVIAVCSGRYARAGAFVAFRVDGVSECSATFRGAGSIGDGTLRVEYRGANLEFQRVSSR
ncbi:MAG: hypothetical protein HOQ09_14310 [Gemmatimonadaceae bacterium]|nr:hypothetical protein [Gemmatimonadaceae bacterium]